MLKGFKDFLMRGNVVDLAVAVVIGAAFAAIVKALVDNIINPLIAAIFGSPDITGVGNFAINGANFSIGAVLQAILNFVFVAAAVYFVIITPMNRLAAMRKQGAEPEPEAPSEEVLLLAQIRDLLGGASTTVTGPPGEGSPAIPPIAPDAVEISRFARSPRSRTTLREVEAARIALSSARRVMRSMRLRITAGRCFMAPSALPPMADSTSIPRPPAST